ncbi:MAG: hypothetical protein EXR58_04095 [Chloroflexi bacterium]|nr:hypothetical protein [Chloroflexota bacterium]
MCVLGALVSVNIFLLAYELSGRHLVAVLTWLALAFSNPLWTYSLVIFPEIAAALLLLYTVRKLAIGWSMNTPSQWLLVGLAIGFLPWLSWRYAILSVTAFLYFLAGWRFHAGDKSDGNERSAFPSGGLVAPWKKLSRVSWALVAAPVGVSALLLAAYSWFIYGRPIPPPSIPELGGTLPFVLPWSGLGDLQEFARGSLGLFFDRQAGLFPLAPIYILSFGGLLLGLASPVGWVRRIFGASCFLATPYVLATGAYYFWNGSWAPPARMITVVAPLGAAGLALLLASSPRRSPTWPLLLVTTTVGMLVMGVMVANPLSMWPISSPFKLISESPALPFRERGFNLFEGLPAFSSLFEAGESSLPWQLVACLAGSGLLVALCLSFAYSEPVRPARIWRTRRIPLLGLLAAIFGGSMLGLVPGEHGRVRAQERASRSAALAN